MEHQKITGFLHIPNRGFFWFSSYTKSCFFWFFLRAPNHIFFEFFSCTKSCFFVFFFVHQIVFFCGFLRAPNGAPVHAFLFDDFASYTKSCSSSSFFVVFFVHQIVFFSGFLRAPNRVFFELSSCTKWYPNLCFSF